MYPLYYSNVDSMCAAVLIKMEFIEGRWPQLAGCSVTVDGDKHSLSDGKGLFIKLGVSEPYDFTS